MNRLEYTRRARNGTARIKNAAEAVMVLAHVARERIRLQQERRSLERRLRRIDARLMAITGTETRLVPIIQVGSGPAASSRPPAADRTAAAMPAGVMAVTLQY
jgi:hypothetical protein